MEKAAIPPSKLRKFIAALGKFVAGLIALVIVGFLAAHIFGLTVGTSDGDDTGPDFPAGGPAEFLYLDSARVAAYLAQVNGGTFDSEKLTRTLTQSQNAEIALEGVKGGASQSEETFVERVVTPTATSSYFALLAALEKDPDIKPIRLRYFNEDVKGLREGRFVSFKTSALLSPVYLSAYLAVGHDNTLAAIFPNSEARQKAAEALVEKVGDAPRVVFALQPTELSQTSEDPTAKPKLKPFVYLMPMNTQLLTEERSLLKYGGGQFTVVGKMVRRFPEPTRHHRPAYVDSPTLETWEQPLRHAPGELLCRTEPHCAIEVRKSNVDRSKRKATIRRTRKRILDALAGQTSIDRRGAVILPVAIYK